MKYLFIAITLLLVACKPEPLTFEVDQISDKPVAYSQYVSGGIISVSLTKTFNALSNKMPVIDSNGITIDTTIIYPHAVIFINNEPLKQTEYGFYGSENMILNDGQTYSLKVEDGNRIIASASAVKMKKVNFDSVFADKNQQSKSLYIYYTIKDNLPEKNYYVVNYLIKKQQDTITNKLDPSYIAKRMLEQNVTYDLITDDEFKSGIFRQTKLVSNNYDSDTLVVSLSNIDKGFYEFLKTQQNAGKLVNQIKGEVINFPSNIQNGFGFFSLHEPDIHILKLTTK